MAVSFGCDKHKFFQENVKTSYLDIAWQFLENRPHMLIQVPLLVKHFLDLSVQQNHKHKY